MYVDFFLTLKGKGILKIVTSSFQYFFPNETQKKFASAVGLVNSLGLNGVWFQTPWAEVLILRTHCP
jgi:hypothetical protein